jgi:hypothetical protein
MNKYAKLYMDKLAEGARDIRQEVIGGRKYPLSYLTGEAQELGEALWNRDVPGIKEEFGDTAYAAQMLLSQTTNTNLPMIFSKDVISKFRKRNAIWKKYFDEAGIPFSVDYLSGGSNFAKPSKVKAVFGLAGRELSDEEAQALSSRMFNEYS